MYMVVAVLIVSLLGLCPAMGEAGTPGGTELPGTPAVPGAPAPPGPRRRRCRGLAPPGGQRPPQR